MREEASDMLETKRYRSFEHFLESARVMIVDDQFVGRKVLEEIVRSLSERITVESFSDPEEALAAFADSPPDLILLDYKMPKWGFLKSFSIFSQEWAPTVSFPGESAHQKPRG